MELNAAGPQIFNGHKHRFGFMGGYGAQEFTSNSGLRVEYNYQVWLYQFQYNYSFLNRHRWTLEAVVQPQFNYTRYKPVDDFPITVMGYEYGANFGIQLRHSVVDDILSIYCLASFGPHFIEGAPDRQADGFVFSDNLAFGLMFKLHEHLYIDLRRGFRHLSNAGLKQPNRGINNMLATGGLFFVL